MLSAPGLPSISADRAAVRLGLLDVLADLEAHQVVVGAEIGLAQRGIFLGEVGVERHDRDRRVGGLDASGRSAGRSTARWPSRRCRPCRACPGRSAPRRPRRRSMPGRCRSTRTRELAFSLFHFSQPWWMASKNGLSRPFTTMTSCFLARAGPAPKRQRRSGQAIVPVSSFVPPIETGGYVCPPHRSTRRPDCAGSFTSGNCNRLMPGR